MRNFSGEDGVDALIDFLDGQPAMSHEARIKATSAKRISKIIDFIDENPDICQISGIPSFLTPHAVNDDQINPEDLLSLSEGLAPHCANYFETALPPVPYWAYRIAVQLRQKADHERERRFLTAWCRHFYDCPGSRFKQLVDRLLELPTNTTP